MDILAARKKAAERAKARDNAPVTDLEVPPARIAAEEPVPQASADMEACETVVETPAPAERAPREKTAAAAPAQVSEDVVEESAAPETEMLSFRLAAEEYVVKVEQVREVLKQMEITPVPHTPAYILGLISLRGTVLPVIDLNLRLGLAPGIRDEKSRIIVVSLDEEEAGLLVDRVTGVVKISPDVVRPVPETIEQGAEFLSGIARKNDRLFILLDLEKACG